MTSLDDVPPIIRSWVMQLMDPEFIAIMSSMTVEQIDVRLAASRGRVRRRPIIVLNGGPTDFVD